MAQRLFSEQSVFTQDFATGTTVAINGTIVDTDGYENVLGIAVATVTSTAQHLKWQQGTATAAVSDTTGRVENSVGCMYLDINRPGMRYGRFVLTASGASSPYRGIITVRYGARNQPTTNDAGTTGTRLNTPGTGTATG